MAHRRVSGVTYTDIDETGEAVLYKPSVQQAVVVNATASIVWLLCDGYRDPGDLARIMSETLKTTVPVGDVATVLDELCSLGVLER